MLRVMQRWFPLARYGVSEGEVAGLTTLPTEKDGLTDDGNLLLEPLNALLDRIRGRVQTSRLALVVTYEGHTLLLFSTEPSALCAFDPFHGPLKDLPLPRGVEYAGLLLATAQP